MAWGVLSHFPEDMLSRVRNRRLYRLYLSGVVNELLRLLDLAWSPQYQALCDVTLAQTAEIQLRILSNLPPGTEELRLSILHRLDNGLNAERAPAAGGAPDGNQGPDGARGQGAHGPGQAPADQAPTLTQVLGAQHLDSVIDASRMQGRGRPSAEVQVCHAGIFRALG